MAHTRKTYRLLAEQFQRLLRTIPEDGRATVATCARVVAEVMAQENANFDQGLFYAACGLNEHGEVR